MEQQRKPHEEGFIIEETRPRSCGYNHKLIRGYMQHSDRPMICEGCGRQFDTLADVEADLASRA